MRGGILEGNLHLQGEGDPFLVSERLWLLAQEAAATGLREVRGALIVETRPVADLDSLRLAEKTDSPYAAPVTTLGVNFNSLVFLVRPAERPGDPAAIEVEPFALPNLSVKNQVITVRPDSTPGAIETVRTIEGETETWTLKGAVSAGSPPIRLYRACRNPALLAGGILKGLLEEEGIRVGAVQAGNAPENGTVIAALSSPSLGILVRSMNLWSNNFMADLLLADMGEAASGAAGAPRIRDWLRDRVGIVGAPVIVDGCGLSPGNRISARQIAQVLVWAHGQERVFPDLFSSFPRPGGEGTLARRFRNGAVPALRAKTGTLGDHGVSSIAGYVDAADGRRYAFCILQQAEPATGLRVADLREREERWLREFVAH